MQVNGEEVQSIKSTAAVAYVIKQVGERDHDRNPGEPGDSLPFITLSLNMYDNRFKNE